MYIDNIEKTKNEKPAKTQLPNHINKPKEEKQNKEVSSNPRIKSKPYKIMRAPHQDATPTIKRVVESITVIF